MQVLVVEDDPVSRMVVGGYLEEAGLATLRAESAEQAFEFLRAPNAVELCLVDVVLPGMDGFAFSGQLKADEQHRNLPVIIMTAQSDDSAVAKAFEAGAMDFIRKPVQSVELIARVAAALRLKREIDARIRNEEALLELTRMLGETNRELQQHLRVDSVTGLASRRELDTVLESVWNDARSRKTAVHFVLFDLDYFKSYNDTYGHLAGDDCLRRVAGAFYACLSRPDELAARYGGEEFALVLPDTTFAQASAKAEQIRERVRGLNLEHSGSPLNFVTISGGLAGLIPAEGMAQNRLIARADQALYAAKRSGRNKVETIEDDST